MKLKVKKISYILSVVLMLSMLPVTAMAGETAENAGNTAEINKENSLSENILMPVESDELGSITIKLENTSKNHPKGGVSLAVSQIADVIGGEFVLKEAFEDSGVDLNQIKSANELEHAAEKLRQIHTGDKKIITTDASGIAMISDLPVGVYLIYATDTAGYETIATSLVSIPTFNEEEGVMNFEVEVIPKHSSPPNVIKTGIDDKVLEYASVSVVLLSAAGVIILVSRKKKKENQK